MADEVTTDGAPPELEAEKAAVLTPPDPDAEDDDAYEDVLYAALKKVYDEMGNDDPDVVAAAPVDGKETGEKKSIDELSVSELRAALKQTNTTLKEVVKATLADREEQHAIDIWNDWLETADPVEKEIAKAAPFEVDDAAGMKKQIERIKAQADAAKKFIEQEVGTQTSQQVGQLKRQYGIITPDPVGVKTSESDQDAKDLAEGKRADVISRRFAKLRGR